MPYPRVEMVSEEQMLRDRHPQHHSICETIREIYEMTEEMPEVRLKCRTAMAMAKKMHFKLKEYRDMYAKDNEIIIKEN